MLWKNLSLEHAFFFHGKTLGVDLGQMQILVSSLR